MNHTFKEFILKENITNKTEFEIIAMIDTAENEVYLLNPAAREELNDVIIKASLGDEVKFSKRYQFILSWVSLHRIVKNSKYQAMVMSAPELAKHLTKEINDH